MTAKAKMKRSCTGLLVPKAVVVTVLLISNTTAMMAVPDRKSYFAC